MLSDIIGDCWMAPTWIHTRTDCVRLDIVVCSPHLRLMLMEGYSSAHTTLYLDEFDYTRTVADMLSDIIADCWMAPTWIHTRTDCVRLDMVVRSPHLTLIIGRIRTHTTLYLDEYECRTYEALQTCSLVS